MTDSALPSHEELAAALDSIQVAKSDFMGSEPGRIPRMEITGLSFGGLDVITAAARERLAQLPEKCKTCGGAGTEGGTIQADPFCHGKGYLYPPALVERTAKVLYRRYPLEPVSMNRDAAIAVLDALNSGVSE